MATSQTYFAVEIKAQPNAVEAVEFALGEAGAVGTELDLLGKPKDAALVSINGYFDAEPMRENIENWLHSGLQIYDLPDSAIETIEIRAIENLDWLAEWKKHWQPTETKKFIVAPTWSEIENSANKIVLRVEPGMAFGTGTHETTRLCLGAIEENYDQSDSFFDVGTGTGVLAMAWAKLQAAVNNREFANARITACDTDAASVEIARENAAVNQVADRIEFYIGSISAQTAVYDFVCANLTADVIAPLLPLLFEKTDKTLVLSGVLREQQNWIAAELEKLPNKPNFSNVKIEVQGEWISFLITKPKR